MAELNLDFEMLFPGEDEFLTSIIQERNTTKKICDNWYDNNGKLSFREAKKLNHIYDLPEWFNLPMYFRIKYMTDTELKQYKQEILKNLEVEIQKFNQSYNNTLKNLALIKKTEFKGTINLYSQQMEKELQAKKDLIEIHRMIKNMSEDEIKSKLLSDPMFSKIDEILGQYKNDDKNNVDDNIKVPINVIKNNPDCISTPIIDWCLRNEFYYSNYLYIVITYVESKAKKLAAQKAEKILEESTINATGSKNK